jgi:hypothetical protein
MLSPSLVLTFEAIRNPVANWPLGRPREAGGVISSLCDYPKRNLCQRAVMAGDPIGRVTKLACHASD